MKARPVITDAARTACSKLQDARTSYLYAYYSSVHCSPLLCTYSSGAESLEHAVQGYVSSHQPAPASPSQSSFCCNARLSKIIIIRKWAWHTKRCANASCHGTNRVMMNNMHEHEVISSLIVCPLLQNTHQNRKIKVTINRRQKHK